MKKWIKIVLKLAVRILKRSYLDKIPRHKTTEAYVKKIPAPRMNPYVEALKSSMSAKIGLPYVYGGDLKDEDFNKYGVDCSGFILRCFQDVGLMDEDYDNNCAGIYKDLLEPNQDIIGYPSAIFPVTLRPKISSFVSHKKITFSDDEKENLDLMFKLKKTLGSYAFLHNIFLIFYGRVGDRLSHVTFWYNHALIAEAGGGGQACETREEALKLKDAKVRFSPYNYRAEEIRDIVQIDFRQDYLNV